MKGRRAIQFNQLLAIVTSLWSVHMFYDYFLLRTPASQHRTIQHRCQYIIANFSFTWQAEIWAEFMVYTYSGAVEPETLCLYDSGFAGRNDSGGDCRQFYWSCSLFHVLVEKPFSDPVTREVYHDFVSKGEPVSLYWFHWWWCSTSCFKSLTSSDRCILKIARAIMAKK
jgi:hypothetical protein